MTSNETVEQVEETTEKIEETVKSTELKVDIEVDKKKTEEAIKKLKESFSGLKKTVDTIASGIKKAMSKLADGVKSAFDTVGSWITDAFSVTSLEEYETAAERFGEDLAGGLYSIHENMSMLETSVVDAVAPIATVVVPVINNALSAVIGLADGIGQVVGALFDGAAGTDALAQSAEAAAGSAEGVVAILPATVEDTLSPQLQAIVEKVQGLIAPIQQIDLSPIMTAFGGLQLVLAPFTQELFAGLEWAYLNLFVPLATWTTESLLPGFLELISGALGLLNTVLVTLQPLGIWLWDNFLQPMAQWTGGALAETLPWLADMLETISTWISENQAVIETLAIIIGSVAVAIVLVNTAMEIGSIVGTTATLVSSAFGLAMSTISWPVVAVTAAIAALIAVVVLLIRNWDEVKTVALNVWESIKQAFGTAWNWFKTTLLDPLVNGFKSMVNGIIGFINGMISGVVRGINGVVGALNRLRFTVPDWVPGLGGRTLGFSLSTVSAPQIPYLAKGAVLPANRPFLAVVGDQRHGTNVEAPLSTIQEAVALVMDDHIAAMMAGFQALLNEQRATRQTIEGIQIGDTVIGQACDRYRSKMAVVHGGW